MPRSEKTPPKPKPKSEETAVDVGAIPEAMREAIQEFGNTLTLERGRSDHTLVAYETDLRQCASWLARKERVKDWREVTATQAMDWLYSLSGDDFAVASLAETLRAAHVCPASCA